MALTITLEDIRPVDLARFHEQVRRGGPDECWPWTGPVEHNGFGRIDVDLDGRRQRLGTHRIAYLLECGTLPAGHLTPDTCGSRLCCNGRH